MKHIISLGAGVQSTTLYLMAAHGEITPMPVGAVFSDTQAEPDAVYDHLAWLKSLNLPIPIHVVTRGNLATDSLVVKRSRLSGKIYQKSLVPLFIKNPNGSRGILRRKCTAEYKVREIIKETRRLVGMSNLREWYKAERRGLKPPPLVSQWIGISLDEALRKKPSREPWIVNRHPLLEKEISRADCLAWMKAKGYPQPPRSACVFCPYHSDLEWLRLKNEHPAEFAKAVAWEKAIQRANTEDEVAKGKPFLHDSLTPLEEVAFDDTPAKDKGLQLDMFNNECEGMCGV